MKKAIKIGLAIVVIALVVVAAQQGLKYYLKGPARYFNAIIVTGEDADVQAAKELYKDQSANVTEYPFKAVNNPIAMLDENGEQIVRDGEPVFIDDIYLVLSKSTAKEMLNDQMFRVRKDSNEMTGSIATIPMTQIDGLDSAQNIYLGSPELMTSLNVDGTDIALQHAGYAWIGYYPDKSAVVIVDDATYDAIQREEQTICRMPFAKGRMDLRNTEDTNAIKNKLSGFPELDIDYGYID